MAENVARAKQQPEAELMLFENYTLSSSTLSSQNNKAYFKRREKACVSVLKRTSGSENKSYRYDISRPTPRHVHRSTTYKKCLCIMMVVCIKLHMSSIHGKFKQHWGWVEQKMLLIKKTCAARIKTTQQEKKHE